LIPDTQTQIFTAIPRGRNAAADKLR